MNIYLINYVQTHYSDIAHSHRNAYEFHYCVGGAARFRCMEREAPFTPGTVTFVRPGDRHQVEVGKHSDEVSFYYCAFRITKEDRHIIDRLSTCFAHTPIVVITEHYRAFFERMRIKSHASNPLQHESAAHLLLSFIYDMVCGADNRFEMTAGDHVTRAIHLMQRSIRQPLSLDDLAQALEISKFHLVRLFRDHTGAAPMKYFSRLKIETACYMLSESRMSIAEIADDLRFFDAFHFSRVFKQITGVSPSLYRQQIARTILR